MRNEICCAFTGHRPSQYRFGYDEEHFDCLRIKELMTMQIAGLIDNGVRTFLTGMALGADTWGAELVLRFKREYPDIRLIAVLPCETQADRWSVEQRERYFNILAQCNETIYASRRYTRDCMLERDRWLVDHAAFLLAVYNGTPKGGTAYTVRYAKDKQKAVITINPDDMTLTPYTVYI